KAVFRSRVVQHDRADLQLVLSTCAVYLFADLRGEWLSENPSMGFDAVLRGASDDRLLWLLRGSHAPSSSFCHHLIGGISSISDSIVLSTFGNSLPAPVLDWHEWLNLNSTS